jgi:hypothetical protein
LFFSKYLCDSAVPIAAAGTFVITAINGTQVIPSACIGDGCQQPDGACPILLLKSILATVYNRFKINICVEILDFDCFTGTCGTFNLFTGDDDSGIIALPNSQLKYLSIS